MSESDPAVIKNKNKTIDGRIIRMPPITPTAAQMKKGRE
jgi:hypothetical protein